MCWVQDTTMVLSRCLCVSWKLQHVHGLPRFTASSSCPEHARWVTPRCNKSAVTWRTQVPSLLLLLHSAINYNDYRIVVAARPAILVLRDYLVFPELTSEFNPTDKFISEIQSLSESFGNGSLWCSEGGRGIYDRFVCTSDMTFDKAALSPIYDPEIILKFTSSEWWQITKYVRGSENCHRKAWRNCGAVVPYYGGAWFALWRDTRCHNLRFSRFFQPLQANLGILAVDNLPSKPFQY